MQVCQGSQDDGVFLGRSFLHAKLALQHSTYAARQFRLRGLQQRRIAQHSHSLGK